MRALAGPLLSPVKPALMEAIDVLHFPEMVYDLMEASVSSMTDDNNLYIDDGLDGFPAFGFRPGSEVKQPYRLYLPEKLPAEFTLVATFKPTTFRTSYLFAVLNPFETVVQLGIRISVSRTHEHRQALRKAPPADIFPSREWLFATDRDFSHFRER